jgi:hypothetical protein
MATERILETLERATDEQLRAGAEWYADGYRLAEFMAEGTPYTVNQVLGVLAAISPRMPWKQNVKLAGEIVRARGTLERGCLFTNLRKANRILAGADPWEELTSQKVRAFFECFLTRGQTDIVCVDRHALAISFGFEITDTRMNEKTYNRIAEEYRAAAREAGMPAAILQATTWVVWRELH